MSGKNTSVANTFATLADSITATAASLWPRSIASLETNRLVADGYPAKEVCDVYFLVSFDGAVPDDAVAAMRAVGFAVREQGSVPGGFITVRTRVRLGAYELSMAGARHDRVVAAFDGFATVIGAARPTLEEVARPGRVASRSVAAM